MRAREPGESRDFREDTDDMGDNTQDEQIALTEEYVNDPPEDLRIEEPEESRDGVGVTEYERQTAREGDEERPTPITPAEEDAVNPTRRP
ncbi:MULTISPECIES: hypothetical protein [Actinomadura]|jgi:pyocin large subunit-like protein|uniref:Pyocin large subunit-like protein n=1 Tax=Actinomadura citrea TaxID=46158 RepID=A0A7Y9KDP2_9ACTN|nr:hypothetical protein [Actinomadura citrea]NYE12218.1 pyocin large subunit-like protein [Actinomadura citrea]GGT50389.1 hypothetical protein GCM10010177_02740 [Actinomadura citrea]